MAKDSLHAFAGKMTAAAVTMKAVAPKAAAAGSLVITTAVRAEIGRTTHGGMLRGVGRSGAKVGAGFKVFGSTGVVRATGPLHILERTMPPHVMPKPGGKVKLYRTPHGALPAIKHPGSRGKHPFEKGVVASRPAASKAIDRVITTTVAKALH